MGQKLMHCTQCHSTVPEKDVSLCVLVLMHQRNGRWCGKVVTEKEYKRAQAARTAWDVVLDGGPEDRAGISEAGTTPPVRAEAPKKPSRCENCRSTENVTLAPCPYRSEIGGDHTPRLMCESCRAQRREDG